MLVEGPAEVGVGGQGAAGPEQVLMQPGVLNRVYPVSPPASQGEHPRRRIGIARGCVELAAAAVCARILRDARLRHGIRQEAHETRTGRRRSCDTETLERRPPRVERAP